MTGDEQRWVRIGQITAPQGIKGEVRLMPDTDFPERLVERHVYLRLKNGTRRGPVTIWLRYARGNQYVLAVEGVSDRNEAEELRGAVVEVPASSLPDLPEGEYYHHQLIGLKVQTVDGQVLGVVTNIFQTGSNDVYVVRSDLSQQEWLIPAIRDVVRKIDLHSGMMTIYPLPGLLELEQ